MVLDLLVCLNRGLSCVLGEDKWVVGEEPVEEPVEFTRLTKLLIQDPS